MGGGGRGARGGSEWFGAGRRKGIEGGRQGSIHATYLYYDPFPSVLLPDPLRDIIYKGLWIE